MYIATQLIVHFQQEALEQVPELVLPMGLQAECWWLLQVLWLL